MDLNTLSYYCIQCVMFSWALTFTTALAIAPLYLMWKPSGKKCKVTWESTKGTNTKDTLPDF